MIADEHDEIDIELLGGDLPHWQTNVFAPAPRDDQPLYGAFGGIEDYPHGQKSVRAIHSYTIDWNADRIQWSVDGSEVRTLRKGAIALLFLQCWTYRHIQRTRRRTALCTILRIPRAFSSASGTQVHLRERRSGRKGLSTGLLPRAG